MLLYRWNWLFQSSLHCIISPYGRYIISLNKIWIQCLFSRSGCKLCLQPSPYVDIMVCPLLMELISKVQCVNRRCIKMCSLACSYFLSSLKYWACSMWFCYMVNYTLICPILPKGDFNDRMDGKHDQWEAIALYQ